MQNKDIHKAAHSALETLFQGDSLNQDDTAQVFSQVIAGEMDNITLTALLIALKLKGETPQEIAGAASALISHANAFPRPDYAFADIVGTGGDGHDTINISSAAAIVAASCGVKVAKHGNRSVSSRSGSADLYREMGMDLAMSPDTARRCLDEAGVCFLFAPQYHAGIRHAMEVRTTLKTRTLFNLLGPLANPARPTHIMIGVYHPDLLMPFAQTLQLLGYQHALVVHGDGLDELALHGPSTLIEVDGENLVERTLHPEDFGVAQYPLSSIKGGEPEHNKALIEAVLAGKGEKAHEAAVAINAGALLKLTGQADSYAQGTAQALEAIRNSLPLNTIQRAAALSQED